MKNETRDDEKRILIVEPNKILTNLLVKILLKAGYEAKAIPFASIEDQPQKGINEVREFNPNLVLCNIILSGESGIGFCDSLHKLGITVPFFVFSTIADVATGLKKMWDQEAKKVGSQGFLSLEEIRPSKILDFVKNFFVSE